MLYRCYKFTYLLEQARKAWVQVPRVVRVVRGGSHSGNVAGAGLQGAVGWKYFPASTTLDAWATDTEAPLQV